MLTVPNALSVLRLLGVPLFLWLLLAGHGARETDIWAIVVRGVVPWWAVAVLVGRDLVLAACLPLLRPRGYGPPPVVYLGKAATFLLLWTFPLLLAGLQTGWFADLCRPTGYAFAIWGSALYLYTGALYLAQIVLALRTPRAQRAEGRS